MRLFNVTCLALLGSVLLCAGSLNIVNPGFETPNIALGACGLTGTTYIYDPTGCGQTWTFQGGSGLTRTPSAFNNPVGPDGSPQAAFLQDISNFSQTITGINIGTMLDLSFFAIQRPCCDNSFAQTVSVEFDGTPLTFNNTVNTSVLPTTAGWTQFTTDPFVAQHATGLLTFRGTYTGFDATAFVDVIRSTEIPEPGTWGLLATGLAGLIWSRRRRK